MMDEKDKEILDNAKEIILKYRDVPGGMEIIRETMNNVYRYFKRTISEAFPRDDRGLQVFRLERMLERKFLPLESVPIFDSDNPPVFPDVIETEDDCKKAVSYIVHKTREWFNHKVDINTDPLHYRCAQSSDIVKKICDELGVEHLDFACNENLGPGLFHCFNVVKFSLPNGELKMYLVDCTYRQFFTYADNFLEYIGMPFNGGASIGAFMMMDESRKKMAEELLTNGYISFDATNIKQYFDGFVFAGRNGFYYEQLGKDVIEKSDYEPSYTYADYLLALQTGGLKNEPFIGRQLGALKKQIVFESGNTNIKTNQNK